MAFQSELPVTSDRLQGFERVRVDPAQTSFYEGREFRTFKELNIAPGATYVIKAVVPLDITLFHLDVVIDDGQLRLGTYVGGTEGGVFSESLPRFNANNMSAGVNRRRSYSGLLYTPQTLLTAGGTHVDGTELDVIRLRTANASGQIQSVGNSPQDERGIAIGTYYFRFLNQSGSATITGTFKARWEERPAGFFQT